MSETEMSSPPEEPHDSAEAPPQKQNKKLFASGVAAVVGILGYYTVASDVEDPLHLYQGLLMLVLAVLPALQWAKRGSDNLPAFEILMLTSANAYALPLLNGHTQLRLYDTAVITASANAVLLYQIVMLAAHGMTRSRPVRDPALISEVLTHDMQKGVGYGLLASTIYLFVSTYFPSLIPAEINSVLRAVFFGIGMVATFAMSRRWGQKELSPAEMLQCALMITVQMMIQFTTLFLVGGISIVLIALIGYVSGARKLPLVPVLAIFAVTAVLHNGKSAMRARYWSDDTGRRLPTLAELPTFFSDWFSAGLSTKGPEAELDVTKKLLDRTSLFHILCLVTDATPRELPYLDGKTYGQVLGQFVPRIFWPDKPMAHISTSTLAIYYGLQDEEATRTTTIGFGMIAEAYANFGFIGIGALAFVLGAFYKKVEVAFAPCPLLSYPGLFLIILTAWSFQVESTMSIWLSSMAQACVGVLGVPLLARKFLG